MSIQLRVVRGQSRTPVGKVNAREGLSTNLGTVTKVTGKTVFIDGRAYRNLSGVTVRHSEAAKEGYREFSGRLVRNYTPVAA